MSNLKRTWAESLNGEGDAPVRLMCFPYAGASSFVFHGWQGHLPAGIDLCGMLLPGRGWRFLEQPIDDLTRLVQTMAPCLDEWLDRPYIFFGHSMGAAIAYELSLELQRRQLPAPAALIVSAHVPPHIGHHLTFECDLSDDELVSRIKVLGGTEDQVLADPDALSLWLPILRSDLRMVERYRRNDAAQVECPIVALCGQDDPEVRVDAMREWERYTTSSFRCQLIDGGHFFVHEPASFLPVIVNVLLGHTDVRIDHPR